MPGAIVVPIQNRLCVTRWQIFMYRSLEDSPSVSSYAGFPVAAMIVRGGISSGCTMRSQTVFTSGVSNVSGNYGDTLLIALIS